MNLLTPVTGAILAAILIPPLVALYFLKLRRKPQVIASTMLWQRSVEDLRANAPFQKLRRNLLLLLQLIALILLVFSVMQPQIEAGRQKGGKTVILIDNSASMLATDVDDASSRLDLAKQRAADRIEALYAGGLFGSSSGETMVLAFSDRAEVQTRFSSSRKELLDAIERIRPTHGSTRIADALKLARAYTTNVDPDSERPVVEAATLEVFTDGRIHDLPDQVLRGESMRYYKIGSTDPDNVATSTIDVQRPYDRPSHVEVFAALLNFNAVAVQCDLQLSVNEAAVAVQEVMIPAAEIDPSNGQLIPGRNNVVFTPFEQPRGAIIEVANLRDDDLMVDNVVTAVVPPPKQLTVAVVAPRSRLVETVLAGMPLRQLVRLSVDQFEAMAPTGGLESYDVIVLDDYAPTESLPPGRYLTFGKTPPLAGLNEFGNSDAQIVLNVRDEHPAVRFVNLDQLFIADAKLLQPGDDVRVIVEGSQGPVVLDVARGPVRVLHVAFDPLETNWPFQRSFVTFIYNAVDWLGHLGEGLTSAQLVPGEAISARVPDGAGDIVLRTPDGDSVRLEALEQTASGAAISWGPIRVSGTYLLNWRLDGEDDVQARGIAVNRADEAEGQIAIVDELELGQQTVGGLGERAGAYTPLWPYAIAFCLVVLMLEWWVYNRKTYV